MATLAPGTAPTQTLPPRAGPCSTELSNLGTSDSLLNERTGFRSIFPDLRRTFHSVAGLTLFDAGRRQVEPAGLRGEGPHSPRKPHVDF